MCSFTRAAAALTLSHSLSPDSSQEPRAYKVSHARGKQTSQDRSSSNSDTARAYKRLLTLTQRRNSHNKHTHAHANHRGNKKQVKFQITPRARTATRPGSRPRAGQRADTTARATAAGRAT